MLSGALSWRVAWEVARSPMKIEPVYLVAPEPAPPRPPVFSRRALLAAIGVAAASGGAIGWFATRGTGDVAQRRGGTPTPRLQWALDLQSGPLDELVRHQVAFLWIVESDRDARLTTGLRRLARAILEDHPAIGAERADLAREIADCITGLNAGSDLGPLVEPLRRVR